VIGSLYLRKFLKNFFPFLPLIVANPIYVKIPFELTKLHSYNNKHNFHHNKLLACVYTPFSLLNYLYSHLGIINKPY
ncbi:hypothetical protein LLE81_08735, partial [Staphylococcus epidermidis]|nr:hypothetical protein [Staphylococcus epidermidis]